MPKQHFCPQCHEPVRPEPYYRMENRTPTMDAKKLKQALKSLRLFGACRDCLSRKMAEATARDNIRIAEVVSTWKGQNVTADRPMSQIETITSLHCDGCLDAVALRLGLLKVHPSTGLIWRDERSEFYLDTLYEQLRVESWRWADYPMTHLATAARNNGNRHYKEYQER